MKLFEFEAEGDFDKHENRGFAIETAAGHPEAPVTSYERADGSQVVYARDEALEKYSEFLDLGEPQQVHELPVDEVTIGEHGLDLRDLNDGIYDEILETAGIQVEDATEVVASLLRVPEDPKKGVGDAALRYMYDSEIEGNPDPAVKAGILEKFSIDYEGGHSRDFYKVADLEAIKASMDLAREYLE